MRSWPRSRPPRSDSACPRTPRSSPATKPDATASGSIASSGPSGIENIVVDSASIEVNRRKRRAKSDRLDAVKLVEMLIRWHNGERKVWAVVHAPSAEDEDHRQLHRELIALKSERTAHVNAIKGLLAGLGLQASVDDEFPRAPGEASAVG